MCVPETGRMRPVYERRMRRSASPRMRGLEPGPHAALVTVPHAARSSRSSMRVTILQSITPLRTAGVDRVL
jgi:hypothetical protein